MAFECKNREFIMLGNKMCKKLNWIIFNFYLGVKRLILDWIDVRLFNNKQLTREYLLLFF